MSAQPIPRFDGAAAWSRLTDEQKDAIGAVALELTQAWLVLFTEESEPRRRAAAMAELEIGAALRDEAFNALPLIQEHHPQAIHGVPLLPSLIGGVCRECGCTENDACPGGCGWAEPDLCTACVEPAS